MSPVRGPAPAVLAAVWLAVALACAAPPSSAPAGRARSSLPDRLSDAEFQRLRTELREANGDFHADNFASNEAGVAEIATRLAASAKGGAYIGVGPEQNFTYIAALRPSIAFIVDIRRQAAIQHLLFKALFELSEDRAAFLSRLFVRDRPGGVGRDSTVRLLWTAFPPAPGAPDERYDRHLADVTTFLTERHRMTLDQVDRELLDYVYRAFVTLGPAIAYGGYDRSMPSGGMNFMTLTLAYDQRGTRRSFLATDNDYQFVRQLHERNLIVPIEGDLAGPVTLRGIGAYLRDHGVEVGVFYPSNVEQYLFGPVPTLAGSLNKNGGAQAFYENLDSLPTTPASVLVRAQLKRASRELVPMCSIDLLVRAAKAGRVRSFEESLRCVR